MVPVIFTTKLAGPSQNFPILYEIKIQLSLSKMPWNKRLNKHLLKRKVSYWNIVSSVNILEKWWWDNLVEVTNNYEYTEDRM